MKKLLTCILVLLIISCLYSLKNDDKDSIECSNNACRGQYEGPEFILRSDIAHQFSNKMSEVVGNKLKELFSKGMYSKVDFDKIEMTTKGMGSGNVIYYIKIPFERVNEKCNAYTSFDHVGGWNHRPALVARKRQLKKGLMPNHELYISTLKKTPEGLQEYWIQWKNKHTQSMCK